MKIPEDPRYPSNVFLLVDGANYDVARLKPDSLELSDPCPITRGPAQLLIRADDVFITLPILLGGPAGQSTTELSVVSASFNVAPRLETERPPLPSSAYLV